jgi:DNA polymerase-4
MRRFSERFLHVDMDAFFVEVERLADPGLRGKSVVVGGLGSRGVVSSASYEARQRGVRSAMPMAIARRRCPHAVFLAPDHRRYSAVSGRVFELLRDFTPYVEGLSIDEAFLDVSGLRFHYESPAAVGAAIRAALRERIGIPASVGIAASKFVAKLASAHAKPDGMLWVRTEEERAFLDPLSIDELWGVGEATRASLEGLGIRTIGDLAAAPAELIEGRLGSAAGAHLAALARGDDPRTVVTETSAKSISVEETFDVDRTDRDTIETELLRLCDRLIGRLRRAGYAARTITLKVRFDDFSLVTRSETVDGAVHTVPATWQVVERLLDRARIGRRPVRLLGVGAAGLVAGDQPRQVSLTGAGKEAAAEAAEEIRDRFGDGTVVPARLLESPDSGTLDDAASTGETGTEH